MSIAIGFCAGQTHQRGAAIAIGANASSSTQGVNSIAIGAGQFPIAQDFAQPTNSIYIGPNLDQSTIAPANGHIPQIFIGSTNVPNIALINDGFVATSVFGSMQVGSATPYLMAYNQANHNISCVQYVTVAASVFS